LCIRENHFISSSTERAEDKRCDWSGSTLEEAWSSGAPGWTCCSIENPCKEREGDCDSNDECEGDLRCGENNCNKIHPANPANFDALADCCVQPRACDWSGTSNTDTWSCCTDSEPCEENEGDCDSDVQCIDELICGDNNCISVNPNLNFSSAADCCIQPSSSKDHDQRNNFGLKIKLVSATPPPRGSG
jgi:hypothetical protein